MKSRTLAVLLWLGLLGGVTESRADVPFLNLAIQTNREALISFSTPASPIFRLEASADLRAWTGLALLATNMAVAFLDSAAPFCADRFYRVMDGTASGAVPGDLLATDVGEVIIHPINHATLLLSWNGKAIYFDPVGTSARFQGLPKADLILVTHTHTDHFDAAAINLLKSTNTAVLGPPAVYQALTTSLKSISGVLTNGATTNLLDVGIEAVAAYNVTSTFHAKGEGNGYVLTIRGKRIYVSGDTEETPEMDALRNIDVAFICMNLPYTMSVEKAVGAVRTLQPGVCYVYHYQGYSNADVARFKRLVGTDQGIEVRLRKWY